MYIESFLKQFWRCVEVKATGLDEFARQTAHFDEKCCGKHLILSGLCYEYAEDEPGAPAYLTFNVWDLSGDELAMDYYMTGYVKELKPIKNGFIAVTGTDDEGSTTYTFKKTKVNPFRKKGKD